MRRLGWLVSLASLVSAGLLAAWIARLPSTGESCSFGETCWGGTCRRSSVATIPVGYCTSSCDDDHDCGSKLRCRKEPSGRRMCSRPAITALGDHCDFDEECASGSCVNIFGGHEDFVSVAQCSKPCRNDAECGGGLACTRGDPGACYDPEGVRNRRDANRATKAKLEAILDAHRPE